jgi:predicted nucleotidyltransferase
MTQSGVSTYESGRRQPSLPVLLRLIGATGHRLEGSLVAGDAAQPVQMSGALGQRMRRYGREINDIAAAHGARNVRVFGSVARGTELADSDLDLLVDLPPGTGLFALGRLRRDLATSKNSCRQRSTSYPPTA